MDSESLPGKEQSDASEQTHVDEEKAASPAPEEEVRALKGVKVTKGSLSGKAASALTHSLVATLRE